MTLTKVRTAFKWVWYWLANVKIGRRTTGKHVSTQKWNPNLSSNESKNISNNILDSNAFPMGMWQKVYSHRFRRLVANTLGQTTSCGMEKPKKFEKSWTMNEIEANFLQKFDKVEQVMKMKLRFSPFPTKGIHSLNFFSRDRQILFEPFLMMDNRFTRCFSYYVEWQVQKLQTKNFHYLNYNFSSRCIQFHGACPIHQRDAHTVLTFVDHTLSQVPTKKNLCKFYVNG